MGPQPIVIKFMGLQPKDISLYEYTDLRTHVFCQYGSIVSDCNVEIQQNLIGLNFYPF